MKVTVHTSFEDLPPEARYLCEAAATTRWFDSLAWFQCLHASALRDSVQLRLYVARDDRDKVTACLFCCTQPKNDRVLRSLSNYYTMEFAPIVRDDIDPMYACAAIAAFIEAERPRWHAIHFDYLRDSNTATTALVTALSKVGFALHRHHQYENWYLDCQGIRYAEYFATRPSRLRNTIERKGRKLGKTHRVEFVLYQHPSDDIDRGVRDYVAVYNSSWKRPEPYPEFMPDLARRLAACGSLRLGVLYLDDKPAAAQFWITTRGEACIYKLAYDEQFAELSVGALLSQEMFRQALDVDSTPRIDYGVGSEPYKREWMGAVQQIYGLRAYSFKSLRGICLHVRAQLYAFLRKHVRRGRH